MRTSYIKRLSARIPKGSKAPPLSTAAELLLGAIAGALAQIFTIPVSVIATRQQIGRSSDRPRKKAEIAEQIATGDIEKAAVNVGDLATSDVSTLDKEEEAETYDDSFIGIAKEIIEEEGVTGLWLGIKPGLVLTVNPAITYGLYERVKSVMLVAQQTASGNSDAKLSSLATFTVGALSKTLATVVRLLYITRESCELSNTL